MLLENAYKYISSKLGIAASGAVGYPSETQSAAFVKSTLNQAFSKSPGQLAQASYVEEMTETERSVYDAYKKGVLPPIYTDIDTYREAWERGDPDHVRMVKGPKPILRF